MTLADHLPKGSIVTQGAAADWRAAIRLAGDALIATGVTHAEYTEEMIRAVEELGPYIVVAPGFALAHSRPSPAVRRAGISWVTLAEPVEFGAPENDPVRLVVALAAPDHDGHIDLLAELSAVLEDDDRLTAAIAAPTPDAVRTILSAV